MAKNKSSVSSIGCLTVIMVLAAIVSFIFEYWYIALIIIGVLFLIAIIYVIVDHVKDERNAAEAVKLREKNEQLEKERFISSPEPPAHLMTVPQLQGNNALEKYINRQIIEHVRTQNAYIRKQSHYEWLKKKRKLQLELGIPAEEAVKEEEINYAKIEVNRSEKPKTVTFGYYPDTEEASLKEKYDKATRIFNTNHADVSEMFGKCKSVQLSDNIYLIFTLWYPVVYYAIQKYVKVIGYDDINFANDYTLEYVDRCVYSWEAEVESVHYLHERKNGEPDRRYSDNPMYSYIYKRFATISYGSHSFKQPFENKEEIDAFFKELVSYKKGVASERVQRLIKHFLNGEGDYNYGGVKKIISEENKVERERKKKEKELLEKQREAERLAELERQKKLEEERQKRLEEKRAAREEARRLKVEEEKRKQAEREKLLAEKKKKEQIEKQRKARELEELKTKQLEKVNEARNQEESKYLPFEINQEIMKEVSVVDFSEEQDYTYTKVISLCICSDFYLAEGTWKDLYIWFVQYIFAQYPSKIEPFIGKPLISGKRIDICKTAKRNNLKKPVQISNDLYIETSLNTGDIIARIKVLARECRIKYADVVILFGKKELIKDLFVVKKVSKPRQKVIYKTVVEQADPLAGLSAEERQVLLSFRKQKDEEEKAAKEKAERERTQAALVAIGNSHIRQKGKSNVITNNIFSFTYEQITDESSSYILYFIDEFGNTISNKVQTENRQKGDSFTARFELLASDSFDKNKKYYLLVCDKETEEIKGKMEYGINIAFASDFDF